MHRKEFSSVNQILSNMSEDSIDIEAIILVQLEFLAKVKKTIKNFKKDGADRQTRLAKLESLYRKFNDNHIEIVRANLNSKDEYFTEEIEEQFDEEFINAVSVVTEALHEKFPPATPPVA